MVAPYTPDDLALLEESIFKDAVPTLPTKISHKQEKAREERVELAAEGIDETKDTLHLAQSSFELFDKLHKPILGALHVIHDLVPPIRLVVGAIAAIWETVASLFFSRDSKKQRGTNILLAAVSVTAVTISVLMPAFAAAMLVAYIGAELLKDFTQAIGAFKRYRKLRHRHKKTFYKNETEKKHAGMKLNFKRHLARAKGIDTLSAAIAVSGAIMAFFPPLTIPGMIVLITATLVGVLFKLRGIVHRRNLYKRYKESNAKAVQPVVKNQMQFLQSPTVSPQPASTPSKAPTKQAIVAGHTSLLAAAASQPENKSKFLERMDNNIPYPSLSSRSRL